jgi:steroid delta-isomerase-like uncharacterized protein
MSREELERLDAQGMAAWDTHDADAFIGMFADDFVWHDWTVAEPIRDKQAAREYFSSWATAFPDMRVKQVAQVIGEDSVAAEVLWEGTNSGPMTMGGMTIPPTGKHVTGRGTYIAKVRDGKVVDFSSHPDVAGMAMQLGLMGPPA